MNPDFAVPRMSSITKQTRVLIVLRELLQGWRTVGELAELGECDQQTIRRYIRQFGKTGYRVLEITEDHGRKCFTVRV